MWRKIITLIEATTLIMLICSAVSAFTPGKVRVKVKDFSNEKAIAGALVTMTPGNYIATTDNNGIVLFSGITPYRNYAVAVTCKGYGEGKYGEGRTSYIGVKSGKTSEVFLPLRQTSTIRGMVTSKGDPVPGAMVVALEDRMNGLEQVAVTKTNDKGAYVLNSVPQGHFSIRAVADKYYQTVESLVVHGGQDIVKDFSIKPGTTLLSFTISASPNYYGNSVSLQPDNFLLFFNQQYYMAVDIPEGAQLLNSAGKIFTPTLPGDYTFAMIVIDVKGVGREAIQTIEMVNAPSQAYPSVIPGPSELPLLYNNEIYAKTSGLAGVRPGERIYLRGWGKDFNLPSPEQYNPEAPMFDIYGNKNGDWGQSAFDFLWSLKLGDGNEVTGLLIDPSAENIYFSVPQDAKAGDIYRATLRVTGDRGLAGDPEDITLYVADKVGSHTCASCHEETDNDYHSTKHAKINIGCEDCHGPGSLHSGDLNRISITHWPGMCGRCHSEFAQWQKSRHSDPLLFGIAEVDPALQRECYKCHYTEGFIGAAASGDFGGYNYPFGTKAPGDTPNISCDVCHDPHKQSSDNPYGIRTGKPENLCNTCHEKKWQNAIYEATADEIGNGYHWDDYSAYKGEGNPHRMTKGCVSCHMSRDIANKDKRNVRMVGGHGLRMRDVGPDGDPGTKDDIFNNAVCRNCHADLDTFDRKGFQTGIKTKLEELGDLLKSKNHGFLPPFQSGKCATCHRGGTLPFINETADEVLNKAYKNYSLILHDRSFGIHNPQYIKRLLDESIAAVKDTDSIYLLSFMAEPFRNMVNITWTTDYGENTTLLGKIKRILKLE